jgi:simple sugar transport system permease protein
MNSSILVPIFVGSVMAAMPLLMAALGELVVERTGVLNLGVEGMMLVGAVAAFASASSSGSLTLGFFSGMLAGMALSLVFAALALGLQANQVATGLALSLFGVGLSAFAGKPYIGQVVNGLHSLATPGLDPLVLLALPMVLATHWFLGRTRAGLVVRAVGESPVNAHALGLPVRHIRCLAVMFGGAMAGLAGAYMSLAITPMWVEGMTGGRGWIALALVVFATWKPLRLLAGALLFGAVSVMQFHAQGLGIAIPSEFLAMLPYVATIVVLVLIGRNPRVMLLNRPAALGKPFLPGG